MNRQKREQLKQMETRTITTSETGVGSLSTTFIPWSNIFANSMPQPVQTVVKANSPQEKKMYIDHDNDPHAAARSRLHARTVEAHRDHSEALRQTYFIDDHNTKDWSVEDAIQAIKDGKFVYRRPEEAKKKKSFYYASYDIRFRDPDKPEDTEGWQKAVDTLDEHYEAVVDQITILDPKDALKKVDSFREHKFH